MTHYSQVTSAIAKYHALAAHFTVEYAHRLKAVTHGAQSPRDRFLVRKGTGHLVIKVADVAYFYTEDKLVFLITNNTQRHLLDKPLAEIEGSLDRAAFFRANRATLVHIDSVARCTPYGKGKLLLELRPPPREPVIVSQERAATCRHWLAAHDFLTIFGFALRLNGCMPTNAAISADIEEILTALHAVTSQAEKLCASASPEALQRLPEPGRWSAAQCLAHLAVSNFAYANAMRSASKPALHLHNHERSGPIRVGLLSRWFLAYMEPPAGRRLRAPRAIAPPPFVEVGAALREFQRSQAAVIELLMECRHLDLNKIRFPNPFVPGLRFTVGAGFLIIAAHERRHIWQASVAISKQ